MKKTNSELIAMAVERLGTAQQLAESDTVKAASHAARAATFLETAVRRQRFERKQQLKDQQPQPKARPRKKS